MKKTIRTVLEAVSGVILLLALLLSVAIFCAKVQNRPFFLFGKRNILYLLFFLLRLYRLLLFS